MANTKTTTGKKATTKPAAKAAKVAEPEQEKKETVTVDGFELAGTPDVPAEVKVAEDTTTTEAPVGTEEEKSVEEQGVEAPENDETSTEPEVEEPEAAPVGTEEEPEDQGVDAPEKEDYVAPETEVKEADEAPVPETMAVLAAEDQRKMNEGARVAEYAPVPQRYDGIVRTAQKLF